MSTQFMSEPATTPVPQNETEKETSPPRHEPTVAEIVERARSQPARSLGAWVCSFTTAVTLWASFTPLDWGWLGWVALTPLTLLVRIENRTRWMYTTTWIAGLGWSVVTLQWMRLGDVAMVPAWVALAVYLSLYFPVFVAASRVAVHRLRLPLVLAAPLVWTGLEFLRATLMTGFAWYFLGHTQYLWTELIQISDLVGAYGVSFLVAMSAACVAGVIPVSFLQKMKLFPPVQIPKGFDHLPQDGIIEDNDRRAPFARPGVQLGLTLSLIMAALCYGHVRRSQAEFKDGPRVALIQGNFPSSLKRDSSEYPHIFRTHDTLTGMAVIHQPDVIVWPETMFRWPLQIVDDDVNETQILAMAPPVGNENRTQWIESWRSPGVRNTLHEMSEKAGATLVMGIDTWRATNDGIKAYNSAAIVTPDEGITHRYDKIHRVIFGEYVPLRKELPWLHMLTPFPEDYGIHAGTSAVHFKSGDWTFAPLICFEDTVPGLVRDIARSSHDDVDVFVNLTNDGWFAESSELDQHLITASFRAIETRTPMVRAVNTGISAVIDGDGVVIDPEVFIDGDADPKEREKAGNSMRDAKTGRWRKSLNAALIADVPLDNRTSVYVRYGDWFAGGCCVFALFSMATGPFLRRRELKTA